MPRALLPTPHSRGRPASMAIIKYAETVAGIRGTIGGITYSANKSGAYVKRWARTVNPRTYEQQIVRSQPALFKPYWDAMSDEDRAAWDAFAADPNELDYNSLGIQYWLTGWQWFVRANLRRASASLEITDTPPSGSAEIAPPDLVLSATYITDGKIEVSWDPASFVDGQVFVCFGSMMQGQNRSTSINNWRLLFTASADDGGPYECQADFEGWFGEPLENYRAFVNCYIQAQAGNRGPVQSASDVVH